MSHCVRQRFLSETQNIQITKEKECIHLPLSNKKLLCLKIHSLENKKVSQRLGVVLTEHISARELHLEDLKNLSHSIIRQPDFKMGKRSEQVLKKVWK